MDKTPNEIKISLEMDEESLEQVLLQLEQVKAAIEELDQLVTKICDHNEACLEKGQVIPDQKGTILHEPGVTPL